MNIIIESFSSKHIHAVAEIEKNCFSQPWSENSLKNELDNPNAYFIVAQADNKTVGYAGLYKILDEGYVTNIAVLDEYRRCGIAKQLLEKILSWGKEKTLSFITLEVRQGNHAAISLYSNFDFKEVGIRKNFYCAPTENALIMTWENEDAVLNNNLKGEYI